MTRMLAVVDPTGLLIARVGNPTDDEWDAAAPHTRFENGFDNALKRYRLVQHAPKRWRFEPVAHLKDESGENEAADIKFPRAALSRCVLALANGAGAPPSDIAAVASWLGSFDAKSEA